MASSTAKALAHLRTQAGWTKMQAVADGEAGLFIGPQMCAKDVTALQSAGITHILAANGHAPFVKRVLEDLCVKVVDIEDSPDESIQPYFAECNAFIQEGRNEGAVLVYCTAGVSRSATIVTAYLMQAHRWSMDHALEVLAASRRWVKPNPGFRQQLKAYEAVLATADECKSQSESSCRLCKLERVTEWIDSSHPDFVVLLCDSCDLPMVVYRRHGMDPIPVETEHAMEAALRRAASKELQNEVWFIDKAQRTIPDHRRNAARCELQCA